MSRSLVIVSSFALLFLAGCLARFDRGPGMKTPPTAAKIEVSSCQIRADLFDCKSAPNVALFVGDYLGFNGITQGGAAKLSLSIVEDHNVVALKATMETPNGLAWRAEAQGDTMMRALVRFELLLEEKLGFKERYLTHDNLRARIEKAKRRHLSAAKATFEYR